MKLKILSMLIILGILSVTPMIYMGKFNPMEFFSSGLNGTTSTFEKLKHKAPENLTSVVTDEKVQVYKWRDEKGVMQFSNTPPHTGKNAQQIELNPNNNVVSAVKVPVKEATPDSPGDSGQPGPYSVKGMKKVMDDAKGIEQMLQQSHEQRTEILNNL